jgi:ribosomal protein S18 acetylase RimI-like enzyme
MLRIERITASQGPLLKELRCRALDDAPYAFSSTLEEATMRSDESWAAWAENGSANPKAITLIAYYDDNPCGMMGCRLVGEKNEVAELLAVWVAPEYRRLKVGQRLLEVVKQWAGQSHAQVLHIRVAEQNASAISFYKAAGGEVTGQRQPFKSDATQEEILLMLKLP